MPNKTPALKTVTIKATAVFEKNQAATERNVINVGGARSSKSYSIAQLLIARACNHPGRQIGVTRKTMTSLRMTAYHLIISLLKEYGRYFPDGHSKSENFYILPNQSRFRFFGMDDPDRIKSTEFHDLWLEEANEFSYEDYVTLLTRISAPEQAGIRNQMFLSLNPTDENGWIKNRLSISSEARTIHSTYRDNPFLSQDYINTLEGLKDQDENYYKIFALGEWGNAKGLIYTNYDVVEGMPDNLDEIIWGLDFGYNNPSALVKIGIKDKELYLEEKFYKTGLTNSLIVQEAGAVIPEAERGQQIYADAAEPDKIADLNAAGFNVQGADKAVNSGIDTLKTHKLHIVQGSENLLKEIQGYRWRQNKNGESLDEPVKFNDHALDAARYAVHTHLKGRDTFTISISGGGA